METEIEALRREVDALRREVAELKARPTVSNHYHYQHQPSLLPQQPYHPGAPFYWPATSMAVQKADRLQG